MGKHVVKLNTWMWNLRVDANILFAKLPHIMNNFRFVKSTNPKYIMYSKHKQVKSIPPGVTKIYFVAENVPPKMGQCDWAFGFQHEEEINNERYMRFPNYVRLGAGVDLIKKGTNVKKILAQKRKFCAFIYGHNVPFRNEFFLQLSKYKRVDSPGEVHNNMPFIGGFRSVNELRHHLSLDFYRKYEMKIEFLRSYKFVIAFENEPSGGYTSEKIYHAMQANCIPIYWGNPTVNRDFNTNSFLSLHEYGSFGALIDRIIELDKDDALYARYIKRPWYPNNQLTKFTDPKRHLRRFRQIFG